MVLSVDDFWYDFDEMCRDVGFTHIVHWNIFDADFVKKNAGSRKSFNIEKKFEDSFDFSSILTSLPPWRVQIHLRIITRPKDV